MANKQRLYFSIGSLLVLISIIMFVIIPITKDITEMSLKIKEEKDYIEMLYFQNQSYNQVKDNFEKVKMDVNKLSSIFVVKEQELDFFTALESIAQKSLIEQKINIQNSYFPEKKYSLNSYEILPITLDLRGTFPNLINFLINLDGLDYYVNINSLNISAIGARMPDLNLPSSNYSTEAAILINAEAYEINKL